MADAIKTGNNLPYICCDENRKHTKVNSFVSRISNIQVMLFRWNAFADILCGKDEYPSYFRHISCILLQAVLIYPYFIHVQ